MVKNFYKDQGHTFGDMRGSYQGTGKPYVSPVAGKGLPTHGYKGTTIIDNPRAKPRIDDQMRDRGFRSRSNSDKY